MLRRGFDPGRGRENDAKGSWAWGEPRAAFLWPVCSRKHLMKSESAVRSEHFRSNNALSVMQPFPHPWSSPFYLFVVLPSGHSCEGRSGGSSEQPWPGQVHFGGASVHSHLTALCRLGSSVVYVSVWKELMQYAFVAFVIVRRHRLWTCGGSSLNNYHNSALMAWKYFINECREEKKTHCTGVS